MNFPSKAVLDEFKKTRGAISCHEAAAIFHLAEMAPDGDAIDLGTHCGKAAMMAAAGFTSVRNFHLVDPAFDCGNLEAWKHSDQGHPDNAWPGFFEDGFGKKIHDRVFSASIFRSVPVDSEHDMVDGRVLPILHGDYSIHAIPAIGGPFSFAFVDTDQHHPDLVKAELELLRNRMMIGGIIALHDWGGQFVGVERAAREMLVGSQYEEVGIPWQDIKPWVADNGGEEGNDSWHKAGDPTPCFVGAIVRRK